MGIDEQREEVEDLQMQKDIKDGICPKCRSYLTIEEVDVGVGTLRRPPYCTNCGWSMESEQEDSLSKLTKGEG